MTFYIQNVDTGYVLDIKSAQTSSHGEIIMFSSHGKSNQLWTYNNGMIYSKSNGYVNNLWSIVISSLLKLPLPRMVLDINPTTKKVITYPAHGKANQKWHFDGDGIVRSDIGLVLDVSKSNKNEGAEVIGHIRHGGRNQMFRRIYVTPKC